MSSLAILTKAKECGKGKASHRNFKTEPKIDRADLQVGRKNKKIFSLYRHSDNHNVCSASNRTGNSNSMVLKQLF
jgi:hypothetical protein